MNREKPRFSIILSPEAVMAVRQLLFGESNEHSPAIRDVHDALAETQCSEGDEGAILHLLGFSERPEPSGTPVRAIDRVHAALKEHG
jgi:hypothetical protein